MGWNYKASILSAGYFQVLIGYLPGAPVRVSGRVGVKVRVGVGFGVSSLGFRVRVRVVSYAAVCVTPLKTAAWETRVRAGS